MPSGADAGASEQRDSSQATETYSSSQQQQQHVDSSAAQPTESSTHSAAQLASLSIQLQRHPPLSKVLTSISPWKSYQLQLSTQHLPQLPLLAIPHMPNLKQQHQRPQQVKQQQLSSKVVVIQKSPARWPRQSLLWRQQLPPIRALREKPMPSTICRLHPAAAAFFEGQRG